MILRYRCVNEKCARFEEVREVRPGETSECEACGWFMESA